MSARGRWYKLLEQAPTPAECETGAEYNMPTQSGLKVVRSGYVPDTATATVPAGDRVGSDYTAPFRRRPDSSFSGAGGGELVLRQLTKRYPSFVAVDRIDLVIAPGESLTLLGPSGSGKTTTLMMGAGFSPPSDGDVLLDGRSITALAPERRNMGVVFQNYALFPHMTVQENVGFPLRMRRQPKQMVAEKVAAALSLVRLENLGERLPKQLSGGSWRRSGLANPAPVGSLAAAPRRATLWSGFS